MRLPASPAAVVALALTHAITIAAGPALIRETVSVTANETSVLEPRAPNWALSFFNDDECSSGPSEHSFSGSQNTGCEVATSIGTVAYSFRGSDFWVLCVSEVDDNCDDVIELLPGNCRTGGGILSWFVSDTCAV